MPSWARAQNDEEERARVSAQQYMLHGMSRDALTAVISDMFKKADKDGSGDLNMAEFQVCLKDAELGHQEGGTPARPPAPWPRHRHHHHLLLLVFLFPTATPPTTAAARLAC